MDDGRGAKDPRRMPILLLAVILTILGCFGVFGNSAGYTDALFEPDYTIRYAPEGGPLAEAGFETGDSVLTVEGIPVTELGMYSRWPRSLSRRPGESITMVVAREGEEVSGKIVYGPRPAGSRNLQLGALLVFLSFLWAGVWALWSTPEPRAGSVVDGEGSPAASSWGHAWRLATLGLAAGFTIQWPDMGSWNGIRDHLHMAAMVLWTLLLFRFFLFFPFTKRVARSHLTTILTYLPWILLLGCLTVELLFHPRFYHSFGGFGGLLMMAYLILAILSLTHSWLVARESGEGRASLRPVLVGMGAAVGGILLFAADALLLPGFHVPGSNWAPVLFGVIPIGMVMGVRKTALRE